MRSGHDWRIQKEREKEELGAAPPFTIALSRQVGARGTSVAREVGAHLGWAVYDRELLEQIARTMNVRVELLKSVDEKRVTSIEEWIELLLTRAPVRASIASCKIQGFSDGRVPKPVRPYPQASFGAKTSHNFIEAGSGQTAVSLSGPVHGEE